MQEMPSVVLMTYRLGMTDADYQLNGPGYVASILSLCFTFAPVIKSSTIQFIIFWSLVSVRILMRFLRVISFEISGNILYISFFRVSVVGIMVVQDQTRDQLKPFL